MSHSESAQGHREGVKRRVGVGLFTHCFLYRIRIVVCLFLFQVFCTCVAEEEPRVSKPRVQSPGLVFQVCFGGGGGNICNYRYLMTASWGFYKTLCVAWMREFQFRPRLLSVTGDLGWPIGAAEEEPQNRGPRWDGTPGVARHPQNLSASLCNFQTRCN